MKGSRIPHGPQNARSGLLLGEARPARRGRIVDGIALLAHQAGEFAGSGGLFYLGFQSVRLLVVEAEKGSLVTCTEGGGWLGRCWCSAKGSGSTA